VIYQFTYRRVVARPDFSEQALLERAKLIQRRLIRSKKAIH